ncbi:MAG: CARDB domain-containing protein [Campylobacterota bacterium]|nr:CARDB domain-containing protein [Campylobacterota bacterium]
MKTLISTAIAASMVISTLGAAKIDYSKYTEKTFEFNSKEAVEVVNIADIANVFPDLLVQPQMWIHSTVESGSQVPVASFNIVSATGALQSPYVNVKVTLSNEAGLRAAKEIGQDYEVITMTTARVDDDNNQYATNITIPPNLSAGTYYIGLEVDIDNQVDELNEFNNRAYIAVEVGRNNANLGRSYRTVSYTAPDSEKNSSCRETYGEYARMATWDDVEYYAQSHSIASLIESQDLQRDEQLFVSDGSSVSKFVKRGSKFTYFSAIDHVQKHQLELLNFNNKMGHYNETLCWIPSVVTGNDEYVVSSNIVNRD